MLYVQPNAGFVFVEKIRKTMLIRWIVGKQICTTMRYANKVALDLGCDKIVCIPFSESRRRLYQKLGFEKGTGKSLVFKVWS